jgi:hypothetical protein
MVRVKGAVMTMEAVEPLIVSPDAGVMVRVLVEVTAPNTSMISSWLTRGDPEPGAA